jgi:hypothetical protein
LIKALAGDRVGSRDELAAEGIPVAEALKLLGKRKNFLWSRSAPSASSPSPTTAANC